METITAKLGTATAKLIADRTDENGNATRSMRLYLAEHIDHVLVLTTPATGDEIELLIPRGGNVEDYINFAIDAAFVNHDETETETETETTDNKEEETIMNTTTETTTRTLTEEEAAAMLAAMADMRDEFGDDFDANSLEVAAATEHKSHKAREARKAYEVAAAKARRKQAEQKLGGRTSMPESELAEYATGKRPTHKTTREALLVYEEPGYELSHGIHDTRQYFAHWARSEQRTDLSYLGRFSSDEAAIEYFERWKHTHRAYIAA